MPFNILTVGSFKSLPIQKAAAIRGFHRFACEPADFRYRHQQRYALRVSCQQKALAGLRNLTRTGGLAALNKQCITPIPLYGPQERIKTTWLQIHAFTSLTAHCEK